MSPVIKCDGSMASPAVGKMAALNIVNFSDQAAKIVTDARRQADAIMAAGVADAEQIAEQARVEGYSKGQAQGLIDGQADGAEKAFVEAHANFATQTEQLQTLLRGAIEQLDQAREHLLMQGRQELLDFALTIARKVTHVEASGDIATARANLAGALEMAGCAGKIQAKVCPDQLDQLREYAAEFMDEMGLSSMVAFVPDPDLGPGDVVLKTRNGEVDARIETQLDNVIYAITGQTKDPS